MGSNSAWSRARLALVRAFREAGQVQRCHVSGMANGYDVARHSFNAVSLMQLLNPGCSKELLLAMLWHDVPERWLGDVPSPALRAYGEGVRAAYRNMETRLYDALGIPYHLTREEFHDAPHADQLSSRDEWWLRAVDKLELLLWCREQLANGVQAFRSYTDNIDQWFMDNSQNIPSVAFAFWRAVGQSSLHSRHVDDPEAFMALIKRLNEEVA